MGTMAELARRVLPNGMTIEWTDLSFQEATQGNAALLVFPVSVLLAFLVLAALYESWVLPLAVILIVPMCMLSALAGVKLYGSDNNTFVQVGLVVLMGLACKNAILIVEFARELEFQGKGIVEAALEACRLRLRPIVMTSVAFVAGTIPLVLSRTAPPLVRFRLAGRASAPSPDTPRRLVPLEPRRNYTGALRFRASPPRSQGRAGEGSSGSPQPPPNCPRLCGGGDTPG
jgi:multidrug efflux pump subunit AcrB